MIVEASNIHKRLSLKRYRRIVKEPECPYAEGLKSAAERQVLEEEEIRLPNGELREADNLDSNAVSVDVCVPARPSDDNLRVVL